MDGLLGVTLSLPEAFVMLEGTHADAHESVFLALVDLVVRGDAKLVLVDGDADEWALSLADGRAPGGGPVGALVDTLSTCDTAKNADGQTYVLTESARHAFARRWGSADAFLRDNVWPALVDRGLLSRTPNALDVLFVIDVWHLTPEGHAERQQLLSDLSAEPHWKSTPATALLAARGLAALSDTAFDALDELEDLMTPPDVNYEYGSSSS